MRNERGAGLAALLIGFAVIAGLAVLVLQLESPPSGGRSGGSTPSTLSPAPGQAAVNIGAAERAACASDYQAVSVAVDSYTAENGKPPTNMSQVQPMLKDPVSGPMFTISITAGGMVTVATPGHPATAGEGNCRFA